MKLLLTKETKIERSGETLVQYWVKTEPYTFGFSEVFSEEDRAKVFFEAMEKHYRNTGSYEPITERLREAILEPVNTAEALAVIAQDAQAMGLYD